MAEYGKNAPLSYDKYLKVSELIKLQHTLSEPESHDEMLFIIIHQTYELWFKQILHEIDAIIGWIDQDRLFRANHSLRTVVAIGKILVSQIHILETMAPIGFLEFRDRLNPASGFQSFQFREIEFVSGLKDEIILETFKDDPEVYQRLKKRLEEPSLADVFWKCLERRGFKVSNRSEKVETMVKILEKPEREPEIYIMQDLLVDHDENISLWRYHHVLMVERMLGMKRGTGGSEGVAYLRTTLAKKFIPELWEARTYIRY